MKFIIIIILFTSYCTAQTVSDKKNASRNYAEDVLKSTLSGKDQHNVLDNQIAIIKDSITAVSTVEPILFSIYKKENIVRQRPYEIFNIDHHWVIFGTLPEGSRGGTFIIIMDDRNGKIIKISHGK